MMPELNTRADTAKQMSQIATCALAGSYDLLLACRDLARFRRQPVNVGDEIMDVFSAVASEVDGLPIGPERASWSGEALVRMDAEAEAYRAEVREAVMTALRELVGALARDRKGMDVSQSG